MQTLILAAGANVTNSTDSNYPSIMTEFNGKPLIQEVIEDLLALNQTKIVIVVKQEDINLFHIDRTLKLIEPRITVVAVQGNLGGAACSALLGLQFLDKEDEVVIINGNEKLTENYRSLMDQIYSQDSSASIVAFDSIHPRYSYAKLDNFQNVIEIREKDPISRNALVGFFWFSKASIIEDAIKAMILKDGSVNGVFYLSPAINELLLVDLKVSMVKINNSKYHPMKSEWHFNEYAKYIDRGTE